MSPQNDLDHSILNTLQSYADFSRHAFRVDQTDMLMVPNLLDQWRQNFQYALGPTNPAFVDAALSRQDILVWGYTLQYNQNGVLWRVDPGGRPHPDDYRKFQEQNRVIQRATERTIAEIQPRLETPEVAQALRQAQPNPAESLAQNGDAARSTKDTQADSDSWESRVASIQPDGTLAFPPLIVEADRLTTVSAEDIKKEIQAWWDQNVWWSESVKNAATLEERQKAISRIVYKDAPYNALMRLYEAIYGPSRASARFENDLKFTLNYVGNEKPIYFSQYDKNWAKIKVSETNPNKDIASSGCGQTAMAMVIATLTGRKEITPGVLAEDVKKYMTDMEGTRWEFYPNMAKEYGIHCDIINIGGDPAKNPDKAKAALKQVTAALNSGKLVIAAMGEGHFTSEGHMLLLYATETGGDGAVWYKVYDPNSSNSNRYNDNLVIVDGPGSERANADVFIREGWCYWIFSK